MDSFVHTLQSMYRVYVVAKISRVRSHSARDESRAAQRAIRSILRTIDHYLILSYHRTVYTLLIRIIEQKVLIFGAGLIKQSFAVPVIYPRSVQPSTQSRETRKSRRGNRLQEREQARARGEGGTENARRHEVPPPSAGGDRVRRLGVRLLLPRGARRCRFRHGEPVRHDRAGRLRHGRLGR